MPRGAARLGVTRTLVGVTIALSLFFWGSFIVVPARYERPDFGPRLASMAFSGLVSLAFVFWAGILVVKQKHEDGPRLVVLLAFLTSTFLWSYSAYYYYLASKREFQKGMSRLGAFEFATSNLTNAGLESP